jgi:hypothetical protein
MGWGWWLAGRNYINQRFWCNNLNKTQTLVRCHWKPLRVTRVAFFTRSWTTGRGGEDTKTPRPDRVGLRRRRTATARGHWFLSFFPLTLFFCNPVGVAPCSGGEWTSSCCDKGGLQSVAPAAGTYVGRGGWVTSRCTVMRVILGVVLV